MSSTWRPKPWQNDVLSPDSDTADMRLAYNVDRSNPFVVFQNQMAGILIAFADGTAFGSVDLATAQGLTFTEGVIDTPLDSDDIVVLKTQAGSLFKIGNPVDNGDGTVTLEVDSLNWPDDELGGRGVAPPNIQITQIKGRRGSPPFRPSFLRMPRPLRDY